MSRPFGIRAAHPRKGPPSPPYQGLSSAKQGEVIARAEAKRKRKAQKRLLEASHV